jgi:hypothetical protein
MNNPLQLLIWMFGLLVAVSAVIKQLKNRPF